MNLPNFTDKHLDLADLVLKTRFKVHSVDEILVEPQDDGRCQLVAGSYTMTWVTRDDILKNLADAAKRLHDTYRMSKEARVNQTFMAGFHAGLGFPYIPPYQHLILVEVFVPYPYRHDEPPDGDTQVVGYANTFQDALALIVGADAENSVNMFLLDQAMGEPE